mmetsp:Transcript_48877/g.96708  ORF Transcript_48877/g.96708 Transcript_48877/m.96708 type:complete len:435 (-) Transcript_48877:186-1490(-)
MMILAVDDTENLLSNGPTLAASSLDSSSSPWSELKGFRAGDQQRKVYAHVRVLNVGNIRVGDQSFDTRFDFECCWEVFVRSELERAKEVQEANMDGNPGKALTWDPGLAFPSAISYEAVGIRTILVHDAISSRSCEENRSSDSIYCGSRSGSSAVAVGRVGFRVKIGGTFKCSQDLRDFPFDKQALQVVIQMGPEARSGQQLTTSEAYFVQNPLHPNIILAQADAEYDFRPVRFRLSATGPLEGSGRHQSPVSRFMFTIPIERDPGNQFFTSLVVLSIASMSFSSFALPLNAMADRLSLPLNILVVLVAFKYSISTSLPSVPYLTLLDKYMYAIGAFVFACFMAAGANSFLGASPKADGVALVLLGIGLGAINLKFWNLSLSAQKKGSAKIGAMGEIDEEMNRLLAENGIMLNSFGSIEESHLERYRGAMHGAR